MTDGTDTEKRNLEHVALFASQPIAHALESAFVRFASIAFFTKPGSGTRDFACTPANTLPFLALSALENQSVLHLSELLTEEKKRRPFSFRLDAKDLLPLHRDMVGHPATYAWRRVSRQDFARRGQRSYYRSGLVWAVAKAFDEGLTAVGSPRRIADVPAHRGMAETLHSIFRLSMRESTAVPPADLLLRYFETQVVNFVALLNRFPEGIEPPEEPEGWL